ncbi:MAG: hypothetical protein M4579_006136 [Chaenotheca gracillima]|nr:MAG: hypothetical protein M4579_006136 [Chaenotheca gracillima]
MALHSGSGASLQEYVLQYWPYLPVAAAFIYIVYQRYLSPLAGVPGPFWASLSRLWVIRRSLVGDTHRVMIDLHSRHGNLVRIAPNEVSFTDVNAIKKVYGAGTKFRKSDWYSVWQGRRNFDLFGERDEKIHGAQRRLVSQAYSMSSLKDLEVYVDHAVSFFIEKMNETSGKSIDLAVWLQLFAFDVIGEVTFSKRFGFMDAGDDGGIFERIENTLRSGAWVGQVPWLWRLDHFLTPLTGSFLGINSRHSSVREFAQEQMADRKNRGSDHQDILAKLLATQKQKPNELDDADVLSMMTSNVFAGSDTTAISLRAFVYHVLKNPKQKAKLVNEIDLAKKAGKLSEPVTLDQSRELPYLQACLQEALRMHPATGMVLPRVVPEEGVEIAGRFIPGGVRVERNVLATTGALLIWKQHVVGVNPWVLHRDESIYGPEPDKFRPERWMKGENGDMGKLISSSAAGQVP